jgi:hypothetical protein
MTEEKVTKVILSWLEANGWRIICFDFPQSGTGVLLHPNPELREGKNKRGFIPDIVAIKENIAVVFENKDRFVLSDFMKVQHLKTSADYSDAIKKLLRELHSFEILYGVGLAHSKHVEKKAKDHLDKIDFLVFVHQDGTVSATANDELWSGFASTRLA